MHLWFILQHPETGKFAKVERYSDSHPWLVEEVYRATAWRTAQEARDYANKFPEVNYKVISVMPALGEVSI